MGFINQVKEKEPVKAHLNFMAGTSYDIKNPILKLQLAASSCFFGEPMYYHRDEDDKRKMTYMPPHRLDDTTVEYLRKTLDAIDPREWRGLTPANLLEKAIDEALDYDPILALRVGIWLRQVADIRTTPQVLLVRAAHHPKVKGTHYIRETAPGIIQRADEPTVGLAYQIAKYGRKAIPNSLKRAWADAIEKFSEYELAKYRMEAREVKLVDVVNLVHAKSDAVSKLMKGELKNTSTWESIISAKGSNKESWEESIDNMGHMALLRNLRNFQEKSVDPDKYLGKLIATAKKGKQLPFRYVSAYNAARDAGSPPRVLDAIETCLGYSLEQLPHFNGRVASLCDNSGSATGTTTSSMGTMKISTIANLTGILTGRVSDDGYIGIFGDRIQMLPVRKNSSVFDELREAERVGAGIGGATENGIWLFWNASIVAKQHWDHVFVYSDMQAGHGGLYGVDPKEYKDYIWNPAGITRRGYSYGQNIDVPALVNKYRKEVNPNVKVYLVQVAGYQDTIIPEFYKNTYILGGWGEGVIRFAAEMAKIQ